MREPTFRDLYEKLFYLIILSLPFTYIPGASFLGELKQDLAAHILIVCIFIFIAHTIVSMKLIMIRDLSFKLFIILFIWIFISFLFNYNTILDNYFKQRSGLNRFLSQNIVFILSVFLSSLFFYYIHIKKSIFTIFYTIRKYVLHSFYFVFIYAFVEYLYGIHHVTALQPIYEFFNLITFRPTDGLFIWALGRITSVAHEPPFLAMYLLFASPWFLSYIFTENSLKKFIPAALTLILSFLCGSRAALIIISFQYFLYFLLTMKFRSLHPTILRTIKLGSFFLTIVLVLTGGSVKVKLDKQIDTFEISKENEHNVSNLTRWGTQAAALKTFLHHPFFGVGFGQQSYYNIKNYPQWALSSYEIKLYYTNPNDPTWPPGYSLFTRLLAELGIVGFSLFFLANFLLFLRMYIIMKKIKREYKVVCITLIVLLAGFNLNALQFDSFRLIGYWLTLAIFYIFIHKCSTEPNLFFKTDESK